MKRLLVLLVAVFAVSVWTASSYAASLNVGGHYRVRAFGIENMATATSAHDSLSGRLHRAGSDDSISFVDHRFRLNLDVTEGPVMGRLQINSGNYNWGESQDSSAWNREMFLKFPLGSTSVIVGKYWAASPYTLGEMMFMDVKEALTIVAPVNNDLTLIGILVNIEDTSNRNANGFRLIGKYAPKGSMYSGAVGYYMNIDNDSTTLGTYVEDRPQWIAGTINVGQGAWNASVTGAYKFGDKDSNVSGVITSYDYKAYAFDVRGSYDFGKAGGPPLTLTAILGVGSGDDNKTSTDTDLEEFTSPSPSFTHTAIFLDHGDAAEGGAQLSHAGRSQSGGYGNLTAAILKAEYKLTDKTTLNLVGATFSLTEEATGVAASSWQGDNIGQEFNVALTQNLAKGLNLTLSGAWFTPKEKGWSLQSESSTASDDTIAEYMAKIKWDF